MKNETESVLKGRKLKLIRLKLIFEEPKQTTDLDLTNIQQDPQMRRRKPTSDRRQSKGDEDYLNKRAEEHR